MSKIEIYSEEKFINLKKRAALDVKLTTDNIKEKLLELPILFTKYKALYLNQRQILKSINNTLKLTKQQKYHYYKFNYDYKLDTATEINVYVEGDNEICQLYVMYDKQEEIVEFLADTVSQLTKMGYLIKSYIDLEKLRNGVT